MLLEAGFKWNADSKLLDRAGNPVRFSIISATNNPERLQTATLIQYDLGHIGIDVQVVPLEFRAMIDRVTRTRQFEACILSFGGADGDPNSEMNVWLSSGSMHLWAPEQKHPGTPWESQIDHLMQAQMGELDRVKRKELYDRVQEIVAQQQPLICLVSPHILAASRKRIVNLQPAVLESYTLWNSEMLALYPSPGAVQ
jgi:peptide/nickel transport system substrate-binding protein